MTPSFFASILTKCREARIGVLFFDGDRVAEVALRAPLGISDEIDELRVGFCELEGPVSFNLGSLDIALDADDPDALAPIPVDELRLGCVQGLDVPIERRDSILMFILES